MKNFCGKCGTKLENGVCPNCREKFLEQKKKNNKNTYIILLVLGVIFFVILLLGILLALLIPDDFKTKKSKENCEYINVFSYSDEQIYYYCLDEVKVYKNRKEKYVDLKKYYEDNKDATRKIIEELDEKNKYEDGSIMYEYYRNLSLLKCANDNIIIFGPEDMKFEDGFCGLEKAPNIKKKAKKKSKTQSKKSSKKKSSSNNKKDSEPTKTKAQIKQEYIDTCQTYNYKDISRQPDNYKGKKAKFNGKVIQVSEGIFNSKKVTLRVAVTKGSYGIWDDPVYVTYTYSKGEDKILEDDIINMYGTIEGTESYFSVLGAYITIPAFKAKYIDIIQ